MTFANVGIAPCNLLLPADHVAPETWACVACDQYTSEPEYWRRAAELVGLDSRNFSRLFKRETGQTPSRFLAAAQKPPDHRAT